MKERKGNNLPQDKDPLLDTPSEASTTKHINFVDEESDEQSYTQQKDKVTEERQKQWKQGLEEEKEVNRSET